MNDESKITTITSICIVLLREIRVERGFHQAQVADWMGKTPSAWTKIEAGKTPLPFETFIRVCNGMSVIPSTVLATAERYVSLFSQSGWVIISTDLEPAEDGLLSQAQKYWASLSDRSVVANRGGFNSILSSPSYGLNNTIFLAPVFQFALDPMFRESHRNNPPIASNGF